MTFRFVGRIEMVGGYIKTVGGYIERDCADIEMVEANREMLATYLSVLVSDFSGLYVCKFRKCVRRFYD
ncbi:MAG TPA: hypothetical protein VKE42_07610 [Candidatus Cybelea sp.]|nr:hypothetical protein [Candidatus Cybelea sp.]